MGTNKAFLHVNGERIIDRTLRICQQLFTETILVTQEPALYLDFDVNIVTDLERGKGPLMGIYTGLFFSSSPYIFVLACDMPFLDASFIKHMVDKTADYDIVVPRTEGGLEPLHAIYSRRLLKPIEKLLHENKLKITGFFAGARKKIIEADEISQFGPVERLLFNLNRPEDWEELKRFSS